MTRKSPEGAGILFPEMEEEKPSSFPSDTRSLDEVAKEITVRKQKSAVIDHEAGNTEQWDKGAPK